MANNRGKTYLYQHKLTLLQEMYRDWNFKTPFSSHAKEWQDLSNPVKYNLILSAMGYNFHNLPVSTRTIAKWRRQFADELKEFSRA